MIIDKYKLPLTMDYGLTLSNVNVASGKS